MMIPISPKTLSTGFSKCCEKWYFCYN